MPPTSPVHRSAPAGLVPRLVARLVGWAAGVFLQVDRTGPPLPPGPVLVTANHPNSLLDPLLIFRTGGRPARPLAKAPLFDQAFTGAFLRALGGLPVYRRQDKPELMHLNDRTFDAAISALTAGDAVQIFPEGITHSEPSLAPLRTGAARIALLSEDRSDWTLGLQVAPVGLTYERKSAFKGLGLAAYGAPFPVSAYRQQYEQDPQTAVRALTGDIERALLTLTLNFTEASDHHLVAAAERLYAAEKRLTTPRERAGLADRMPRLKAFERGFAWLRATDPDRHRDLNYRVARYSRKARALGAAEADVPSRYRLRAVARYLALDAGPFVLGSPLALLGTAAWAPLLYLPGLLVRLARPHFEAVSTYKLSAAFILAPLILAGWTLLGWWYGGLPAAATVLVGVPILGLVAGAWRDQWRRIREDIRLYFRAIRKPGRLAVLRAWRRDLVAEFEEIAVQMEERSGV